MFWWLDKTWHTDIIYKDIFNEVGLLKSGEQFMIVFNTNKKNQIWNMKNKFLNTFLFRAFKFSR